MHIHMHVLHTLQNIRFLSLSFSLILSICGAAAESPVGRLQIPVMGRAWLWPRQGPRLPAGGWKPPQPRGCGSGGCESGSPHGHPGCQGPCAQAAPSGCQGPCAQPPAENPQGAAGPGGLAVGKCPCRALAQPALGSRPPMAS